MPENPPSDDSESAARAVDESAANSVDLLRPVFDRIRELEKEGLTHGRAWELAHLEAKISRWPEDWGNELKIVLYGDFQSPETDLQFQDLGITVEAGHQRESIVRGVAQCSLLARIAVSEKSISGVRDAAERIGMLLGILTALGWGNSGCGWWSHVTHPTMAGILTKIDPEATVNSIKALQNLSPDIKRKVSAALYWIREPTQMMMEGYRSNALRVYAGYWNAFECLVEAVCIVRPRPKPSKLERQQGIDRLLRERGGNVDAAFIADSFRLFVDQGFVGKASHALEQCFPGGAEKYIGECFTVKPDRDRLYNIRNAINHGDIDAEDFEELMRVEDKQRRLWMIVFNMLGEFIPIPRPIDA